MINDVATYQGVFPIAVSPPALLTIARSGVWLGEVAISLTQKEETLLRYLATRPGRVFLRSELLSQVWGRAGGDGTRTLDVHVQRLRSKLQDLEGERIRTVRKVGYKLVGPVRLLGDVATS